MYETLLSLFDLQRIISPEMNSNPNQADLDISHIFLSLPRTINSEGFNQSVGITSSNLINSDFLTSDNELQITFGEPSKTKMTIDFGKADNGEMVAQVKEMIYRTAALRPVKFWKEVVEKPKRKNVRISSDPQTVAARRRRERISERLRVLQRLIPGGNKMDTASMLEEAANYLKFLKTQVSILERIGGRRF